MIIGSYPCCDAAFMCAVPERTPAFFKEECPNCGAVVWHKLSRVDPQSWLEADFLKEYEIDQETKTIKPKGGADMEKPKLDEAIDYELVCNLAKMLHRKIEKDMQRDISLITFRRPADIVAYAGFVIQPILSMITTTLILSGIDRQSAAEKTTEIVKVFVTDFVKRLGDVNSPTDMAARMVKDVAEMMMTKGKTL